jgi:hypothetical protein
MPPSSTLRGLLREPLVHFLALGGLLFVLWGTGGGADPDSRRIVVGPDEIGHLKSTFEAASGRPPDESELRKLIAEHIRNEVFYREAVAQGLDREDPIVRQRLRQKMELRITGMADIPQPTEAQLDAWLGEHADRYRTEARVSLRQVLVKRDAGRIGGEAEARRLLRELQAGHSPAATGPMDEAGLPVELHEAPVTEIAELFGSAFAAAIEPLGPGVWQGPIESGYGWHLVRVEARDEGRLPALDEIREALRRDWTATQAAARLEESYQQMLGRYTVRIEGEPPGEGAAVAGKSGAGTPASRGATDRKP